MHYLAIGLPTLDLRASAPPLLGGSAVYAAAQAARLGCDARMIGKGDDAAVAELAAFATEFTSEVEPATSTVCFTNVGIGTKRRQSIANWPGQMKVPDPLPEADIIHLAPVAQEFEFRVPPTSSFVGVTPQGWLRKWDDTGTVTLSPWDITDDVAAHVDAMVVSQSEEQYAADALGRIAHTGGLAVVTLDVEGCRVLQEGTWTRYPAWKPIDPVDDTGAGDIFAATLFVELRSGLPVEDAVIHAQAASMLSLFTPGLDATVRRADLDREIASQQH